MNKLHDLNFDLLSKNANEGALQVKDMSSVIHHKLSIFMVKIICEIELFNVIYDWVFGVFLYRNACEANISDEIRYLEQIVVDLRKTIISFEKIRFFNSKLVNSLPASPFAVAQDYFTKIIIMRSDIKISFLKILRTRLHEFPNRLISNMECAIIT